MKRATVLLAAAALIAVFSVASGTQEQGKQIADKCTWCYHRVAKGQSPACVTVCPTQARLFGDLKDTNRQVAKVVREDRWRVLKPDMHTDPQCFYVGSHREIV